MKTNLFIVAIICGWLSLFFFTSCKKEKDLGPLYEAFIGKWECIDSSTPAFYEITKSGYFSFSDGLQRNVHFKVFGVNSLESSSINEVNWKGLQFIDKKTTIDCVFYFNETMDTITITKRLIDGTGNLNTAQFPINYYFVRK